MQAPILRKLFLAFMQVHILHHAGKEPLYGGWMTKELARHGYEVSAGTLYPILHNMEKEGLLLSQKRTVEGKMRKYYEITPLGTQVLSEAKIKIAELSGEAVL